MLLDLVDALIVVTITQANVEPVMRDPALQAAYATYEAPPPDDLRRPISVNAVALSLGLSFETVRRRISRLARLGVCQQRPTGFVVPTARVNYPGHRRAMVATYERMQRLHEVLSALGLLAAPAPPTRAGPPPLRAAARLSAAYLLRVVDAAAQVCGDVVDAAVWLEVLRCNTEERSEAAAVGGESLRRPVAVAAAARRLGLAHETVRRRLAGLTARGACARVRGGYIIPDAFLRDPDVERLAERNLADLQRMYAALADLDGAAHPAAAAGCPAA